MILAVLRLYWGVFLVRNANKKKWSEMSKKDRFWKIFGLVIRLLALAAVLAIIISLWVSARRFSNPDIAKAETVDVPPTFGLGTSYYVTGSGFERISSPWISSAKSTSLIFSFEDFVKGSPLTSSRGFFPMGIYWYSPVDFDGGVEYAWTYLIGINFADNGSIYYQYVSSGQNYSSSPPSAIVVPIYSRWTSSLRSTFADMLYVLHYTNSPADSGYINFYVPISVNSDVQKDLITAFCRTALDDLYRPQYQSVSTGSDYQEGYNGGYSAGYTAGAQVSQSEAYQSGYNAGYDYGFTNGESVSTSSSYSSGYSAGQSAGYSSGYDDGLAAGQRADKNVNLDWVISSVGGLFDIKMGTGANALTFGDIVFTMVSISIFGGVLKLFFGG